MELYGTAVLLVDHTTNRCRC